VFNRAARLLLYLSSLTSHQISESRVSRSVGAVVANCFPVYVTQSIPLSPEGVYDYPLHTLRILAVVHSDSALSTNRGYPAVEQHRKPLGPSIDFADGFRATPVS
jgi:hypothetical protein